MMHIENLTIEGIRHGRNKTTETTIVLVRGAITDTSGPGGVSKETRVDVEEMTLTHSACAPLLMTDVTCTVDYNKGIARIRGKAETDVSSHDEEVRSMQAAEAKGALESACSLMTAELFGTEGVKVELRWLDSQ
jgi:hypothetical protein